MSDVKVYTDYGGMIGPDGVIDDHPPSGFVSFHEYQQAINRAAFAERRVRDLENTLDVARLMYNQAVEIVLSNMWHDDGNHLLVHSDGILQLEGRCRDFDKKYEKYEVECEHKED